MSLTSELSKTGSPIRAYIESVGMLVCDTKRGSVFESAAKRLLGFDALDKSLVVPPVPGANPSTVGTAFDYRLRYDLHPFVCAETVAYATPRLLTRTGEKALVSLIDTFFRRTDVLVGRLNAHECELTDDDDVRITRACVVLALLEAVYRSGKWTHLLPVPTDLEELVPDEVVSDVVALHRSTRSALASIVGSIRTRSVRYVANPVFAGSVAVGGADADLLVGDTLLELKTTKKLDGSSLRSALLQLLGYTLLDYDDIFGIRQVGAYFARQEYLRVWPVWQLVFPSTEVIAWVDAGVEPSPSDIAERLRKLRNVMQGVLEESIVDLSEVFES